ncbi:MAG: AsmA family protein [Proteobacteria bacterium]|nr:AsmA family protein [Pseudomonadota bacterium]
MKKLLIGLAAVVVLIVAVAVAAPFFIPVDTIRDKVIAGVKTATGRDLKIAGPVKVSVFPVLGVEASQVSFSNAPGASAPEMAQIGKLEIALKILPLLSSQLAIDRFVLNDPVILLEIDKQGRPNWAFGAAKPAAAAPQPAPAGGGARMPMKELDLGDIRVVNGKITYFDHRTGQKQELSDINMKLSLPNLDSRFSNDGSVTWRGKAVKTAITVENPRAVMDGKTSDVAIKVASEPVNFDFKGKLTNANPVKVEGPIDLKVPSVRGLAAWTGNPLQMPGDKTFGPLEIKGVLAMVGSKIGFTDAQLAFDAIKAKGEFAFDGGGAKPRLQGKLDVEKLDVNPYLPPEAPAGAKPAAAQPSQPAATKSSGWSDDPIDMTGLRAADADFALGVGSMQVRKIQIGQSALALQLKDGRLVADLSKLALYQGNGQGKLMLDGSGAVPGIDAAFKIAGIQAEPLLRDAAGFDRLTGTGGFDLAVTGRGRSQRELVGALNGKGDLKFTNGVIKGFDLGAMIKNVGSAFGAGGGQTEFSQLTATYTITNGILKNSDLDLQAPIIHATGAGTADLPKRTVDYKIKPLNANIAGVNLAGLAIAVSGPWDDLSYRPDLTSGVVQGAGKVLEGLIPGQGQPAQPGTPASKPGQIPGADTLKGLFGGGRK